MSFRPYRDLMSRDFLILEPNWTVARTLDLLYRLDPEYVLLPLPQGDWAFCVGTATEIEIRLARTPENTRLQDLPDLLAEEPIPIRDAWEDADHPPDLGVIVEEERIVGIFDIYRGDRTLRGVEDAFVDRFLLADYPSSVSLGDVTSILVSLEVDIVGEEDAPRFELPVGSRVDLVLVNAERFEVEGSRDGYVMVESKDVEPKPFQFRIRATDVGLGQLKILAFQEGSYLGRLIVSLRVETQTRAEILGSMRKNRQRYQKVQAPAKDLPDLTLMILEDRRPERRYISYLLTSPAPGADLRTLYGPHEVTSDLETEIQDLLLDCEKSEELEDHRAVLTKLRHLGSYFFEHLLPTDLQRHLHVLGKNVRTVQIMSNEHLIPWEIFHFPGVQERVEKDDFFATRFALSRWRLDEPRRSALRLDKIGLLAPAAPDLIEDEIGDLPSLDKRQIERLPGDYVDLLAALATKTYQALHFSGHGASSTKSGDRATVNLENFTEFRPSDVRPLDQTFRQGHPLVFFNACNTGHGGRGLDGAGGWARRFLAAGASAFIGTLWSVRNGSAQVFSRSFYSHLFEGKEIAEAVRLARLETREAGGNQASWLAYTLYADPLARLDPQITSNNK